MNRIWCWGIGKQMDQYYETLIHNYDIAGIVDSNNAFWGSTYRDYIVRAPECLREIDDSELVITAGNVDEILETALSFGFPYERIRCIHNGIVCDVEYGFAENVYSQDGEECYLKEKFNSKKDGFYVDVGCFHPFRFNNTYWAYRRGWSGINIDPNEKCISLFNQLRSRDININCGVSDINGEMDYYRFSVEGINSFLADRSRSHALPVDTL
nr:hypothetical protein [Lachnospiraceae bacterium]